MQAAKADKKDQKDKSKETRGEGSGVKTNEKRSAEGGDIEAKAKKIKTLESAKDQNEKQSGKRPGSPDGRQAPAKKSKSSGL